MKQSEALAAALSTEHQAIYAYGVLGAHLDERARSPALEAFDAHRRRRDSLLAELRARRLPTPGPAASYDVTVTSRTQALALAVRVETEVGVRWHDVVGATEDPRLRKLSIPALQDSAVRAARWRRAAGTAPATVALPGTG